MLISLLLIALVSIRSCHSRLYFARNTPADVTHSLPIGSTVNFKWRFDFERDYSPLITYTHTYTYFMNFISLQFLVKIDGRDDFNKHFRKYERLNVVSKTSEEYPVKKSSTYTYILKNLTDLWILMCLIKRGFQSVLPEWIE